MINTESHRKDSLKMRRFLIVMNSVLGERMYVKEMYIYNVLSLKTIYEAH
jgi:hypothetical protein